jgi:hypothetical protein
MGDCVDADVDDVGFLEKVAQSVQDKYTGAGKLFVSGNSAGGMMVYQLLCESSWFDRHLTAASVFSGGVGERHECKDGKEASRVPLLVLHGQIDDVIGFKTGTSVDGSPFQATVDTVKDWVAMRGCNAAGSAPAAPFFAAQKIECRDYCGKGGVGSANSGARNAGENAGNGGANNAASNSRNGAKNAVVVAAGAKNAANNANAGKNAKNQESGYAGQSAPMRFCSVPGKKHNLYDVMRSFPIDVSAAWFAKHAGASWGPVPPS